MEQEDCRQFKDRLKTVAKTFRSVNDFSRKCGIANSLMLSYLGGKSLPGLDNLLKIAGAAEVSVMWLACGKGPFKSDSWALADGRKLELAMQRLDRIKGNLRDAAKRGEIEMTPAQRDEVTAYAYFYNLDEKQITEVMDKWGQRLMDARRLDFELLKAAVKTVEEILEALGQILPASKKADIITILYEKSLCRGKDCGAAVDRAMAKRLVMLAL